MKSYFLAFVIIVFFVAVHAGAAMLCAKLPSLKFQLTGKEQAR